MSAAEQHELGCPLPASVVARTESIRRRVAMLTSAGTRTADWMGTGNLRRDNYNDQMVVLRYTYVLALVVWLGGMIVLGAIVAPATFQILQASAPDTGRALAGELFGTMLVLFHYVAYGCGAALLLTLAVIAIL